HVHDAADDARLRLAPVAAGDRGAVLDARERQPVRREQRRGVGEGDVVHPQHRGGVRGRRGRGGLRAHRGQVAAVARSSVRATLMSSTSCSPSLTRSTLTASASTLTYLRMTSSSSRCSRGRSSGAPRWLRSWATMIRRSSFAIDAVFFFTLWTSTMPIPLT